MGFFKNRRNNDEAFKKELEREALERMNHADDGLMLPFDSIGGNLSGHINNGVRNHAPNVLTADELMRKNQQTETIHMKPKSQKSENSAEFLYNKMTAARNNEAKKITGIESQDSIGSQGPKEDTKNILKPENIKDPEVKTPEKKEYVPFDINAAIQSLRDNFSPTGSAASSAFRGTAQNSVKSVASIDSNPAPKALDTEKGNSQANTKPDNGSAKNPLHSDAHIHDKETESIPMKRHTVSPPSAEQRRTSLLARCNAYLEDDEFGTKKIDNTEKYKLESVESILQDFEAHAQQRIQKNLNIKPIAKQQKQSTVSDMAEEATKKSTPRQTTPTAAPTPKSGAYEDILSSQSGAVKHYSFKNEPKPTEEQIGQIKPDKTEDINSAATRSIPKIKTPDINQPKAQPSNSTQIFSAVIGQKQDDAILDGETEPENHAVDQHNTYNEYDEIDDYKDVRDRTHILEQLVHSKAKLKLRCFGTVLLLVLSTILITPLGTTVKSYGMPVFCVVNLLIFIVALACNSNIIKSISSLFTKEYDIDLPVAVGSIAVLIHSLAMFAANETALPLTPVAIFALLFSNIGKASYYKRIINNFTLIANDRTKNALTIVNSKSATRVMVGNAIEGSSLICCGTKTTNVHDFLKYSYCEDPTLERIKKISIISLILGIGVGIAATILSGGNWISGVSIFAAIACVGACPAGMFVTNLPLKAAAGRLSCYNAMLTGYRAASELDLCNAVAADCKDLFPEGTVRMIDMKLLSPNPIDRSILDAAALTQNIGSPLAGMFKQALSVKHIKKSEVDTVVYEDKMGVSGWVDGRRVFVGNRNLMEAHGFHHLPPVELDKKIMRKGYFPVYLASDNVPCALFVAKYAPDSEIVYEMRRLCNTGTTILINNCDPNITSQMVCDYFGVYKDTVSIMSKQGCEQHKLISSYKESKSAGAAFGSSVCGLFATLTAAIGIKKSIGIMSAIHITMVILGFLLTTLLVLMHNTAFITTPYIMLYQFLSMAVICLYPFIKRP